MAFDQKKITKLDNIAPPDGVSPNLGYWFYRSTGETLATIVAANYFDTWGAYIPVGDVILCEGSDGLRTVVVATNTTQNAAGGHVTVTQGGGKRFVAGQISTVTAADTVVTGLALVTACGATLDDSPGDDPMLVSATIGDQAGAPAAGSIIVKTWKNTGGTDPTPAAASTFTKKVNWWAFGS